MSIESVELKKNGFRLNGISPRYPSEVEKITEELGLEARLINYHFAVTEDWQ